VNRHCTAMQDWYIGALPSVNVTYTIPRIVRQSSPLQQQSEEVDLHILPPQHLSRPISPSLRDSFTLHLVRFQYDLLAR